MRRGMIVVLALAIMAAWAMADRGSRRSHENSGQWPSFLPVEALDTHERLRAKGRDHRALRQAALEQADQPAGKCHRQDP